MSSNRLIYDTCSYKTELSENTNQLSYLLDPSKYYRCNPCRMELGIVGGNDVSQIKGNIVDLENDLRGQTRYLSKCPSKKNTWVMDENEQIYLPNEYCHNTTQIDASKVHLPPCQIIKYEPVPLPPPIDMPKCSRPWHTVQFAS